MKRLVIHPEGWPRPGLFLCDDMVGLKTEYGDDGYCDSGESFCAKSAEVQPVSYIWEVYEI